MTPSHPGGRRLALFDLDGTLIPTDSDHAFGELVVALGWADAETHRRQNDSFYADYLAGTLNIQHYTDFATAPWRQRSALELEQAVARFVRDSMQPLVRTAALQLVRQHQQAGDLVAIVTATNDFVARPVAALFGVDALIATVLQRDVQGRVTGLIEGVPCFREGKISRVNSWLSAQSLSLAEFAQTHFYSDSINDLPLLEQVTHPVATNPGPALERIAHARGWPVLKLFT
jgi:HAD superfamily hydrolase (TIGR01490 family)